MVLEVGVVHYLMHKTGSILDAGGISCRVGAIQSKVELEVGEVFLKLQEVFEIEHLVECACSVKEVHNSVGGMQRARHVHYLCTQRRHSGTTAHPHHLCFAVKVGEEVAVGAAHKHLIPRLEREDIG